MFDIDRCHFARTFQPIEAVGRQQDEMDDDCEDEEEGEQGHQRSPWIEHEPHAPHNSFLLNQCLSSALRPRAEPFRRLNNQLVQAAMGAIARQGNAR